MGPRVQPEVIRPRGKQPVAILLDLRERCESCQVVSCVNVKVEHRIRAAVVRSSETCTDTLEEGAS